MLGRILCPCAAKAFRPLSVPAHPPCPRNGAARVQPGSRSACRALRHKHLPGGAGTFCASFAAELGSARLRSALPAHVWSTKRCLTPKIAPSLPAMIAKGCFVPENDVGAASPPLALVRVWGKAWLSPQLVLGPSQAHPGARHGWDGPAGSVALCVTAGLFGDVWWHPLSDVAGCEAAGEPRDEGAGRWMTAGGMRLLGQVAAAPPSLSPKEEKEGRTKSFPWHLWVLGCCPAPHYLPRPHHPLCPTPPGPLPGRKPEPVSRRCRLRLLSGAASSRHHKPTRDGTQPPPSLYPSCATSCPQGRGRGARGRATSVGTPCPTLVLGPVPPPLQGPAWSTCDGLKLVRVAGATRPSLPGAPNGVPQSATGVTEPWVGVWVRGPSWHSAVPCSAPHPPRGRQLGSSNGDSQVLLSPCPSQNPASSSSGFTARPFLTLQPGCPPAQLLVPASPSPTQLLPAHCSWFWLLLKAA